MKFWWKPGLFHTGKIAPVHNNPDKVVDVPQANVKMERVAESSDSGDDDKQDPRDAERQR